MWHGYYPHHQSQINSDKPIKTSFKTDGKNKVGQILDGDSVSHSRDPQSKVKESGISEIIMNKKEKDTECLIGAEGTRANYKVWEI